MDGQKETIASSICKLNADIVCLCETWLQDKEIITCDNYKWIGHNCKILSKRAVRGSGGVGVLVRLTMLRKFKVSIF